jgi:hypothetical protein
MGNECLQGERFAIVGGEGASPLYERDEMKWSDTSERECKDAFGISEKEKPKQISYRIFLAEK